MYLVSHIPKTHHSSPIKGIFLKHINAQDDNEGQFHKTQTGASEEQEE